MQQNFNAFHKAHPEIEKMFLKFSVEMREAGITLIRADEILHRIRWELLITSGDYNMINDLSAFYGNRYAMKLMTETKGDIWCGFFDLTVKYN